MGERVDAETLVYRVEANIDGLATQMDKAAASTERNSRRIVEASAVAGAGVEKALNGAVVGSPLEKQILPITRSLLNAERGAQRLKDKLDPALVAQRAYNKSVAEADEYLKRGLLTQDQHTAALKHAAATTKSVTGGDGGVGALSAQLALAQASGNHEQAEKLGEELAIRQRMISLQRDGLTETEAQAVAEQQVVAATRAREAQEERVRETISLSHQLDLARIEGNAKVVAKLEEEVAVRQRVLALERQGLSTTEAQVLAEEQVGAAVRAREAKEARSEGVGAFLGQSLANTRLGVVEEGSAKIPVFGRQLELLGPAGLVAAAGVGAAAVAMEETAKAAEFAESVEKAAQKLGLTTDALQEFDFVALKSGIPVETFRGALQSANAAFGAFMTGVGDGKVKKAFEAIGMTPEKARQLGDLEHALPVMADGLTKLGNAAEQTKLSKMMGAEELLPALMQGKAHLEEMQAEAHKLGLVMDEDMISKGGQMAEQMKITKDVISHDLMRAFIDLAPAIQGILKLMSKLAEYAADAAENIKAAGGGGARALSEDHLKREIADTGEEMKGTPKGIAKRFLDWRSNPIINQFVPVEGVAGSPEVRHATAIAELKRREEEAKKKAAETKPPTPGVKLSVDKEKKAKKPKAAPADPFPGLQKEADASVDEGEKAVDQARAALTANISAHAEFERRTVADEAKKKDDAFAAHILAVEAEKHLGRTLGKRVQAEVAAQAEKAAAQIKAIQADAGLTDAQRQEAAAHLAAAREALLAAQSPKAALVAEAQIARLLEQQAAGLKTRLIDQAEQIALEKQQLEADQRAAAVDAQLATEKLSLTRNVQDRIDLELQALSDQRNQERNALRVRLYGQDGTGGEVADGKTSAEDAGKQIRQFDQVTASQKRVQRSQSMTPGQQYADGIKNESANAVGVIELDGLKNFNDALVQAVENSKNLGEAFHAAAKTVVDDLIKIGIERTVTLPLANMLFGDPNAPRKPGAVVVGDVEQAPPGGAVGAAAAAAVGGLGAHFPAAPIIISDVNPTGAATPADGVGGGSGGLFGLLGSLFGGAGHAAASTGQGVLGLLSSFLPHFAAGTGSSPGGPELVGENGPEVINGHAGDTVTPNSSLLNAVGGMTPGAMNVSHSTSVHYNPQIDARGAGPREVDQLRALMEQERAALPQRVVGIVNSGLSRPSGPGAIRAPAFAS